MARNATTTKPHGEAPVVIRAVTLPVGMPLGITWDDLNAALKECFRLSTLTANWVIQELYRRDTYGEAKTPAAVKPLSKKNNPKGFDPYRTASKQEWFKGWEGAKKGMSTCLREAHRAYLTRRFDVMVRGIQNLLTYRYPFPFPVHNQAWFVRYEDGFPVASVELAGLGRVDLRLKRRADFGRQLAMFRELVDGTAEKGAAALYRNRKGDLLLKLVAKFPRRERATAPNVAFIHTDPNSLLVVEVNGHAANVTNADHIRREFARSRTMIARHKRFLERTRGDKKREVRMDRRHRANLGKYVEERCAKQDSRVDTFVKQVAAQVARMCERKGVGTVCYDDSVQDFMPDGFRWSALKTRLRQLLEVEMGVEWIDGDGAGPLAELGPFGPMPTEERQAWLRKAQAICTAGRRAVAHKLRPAGKSHPAVTAPSSTGSSSPGRTKSPASVRRSTSLPSGRCSPTGRA